jgi:hypothetical protein
LRTTEGHNTFFGDCCSNRNSFLAAQDLACSAMIGQKQRERRRVTSLKAQMRTDDGWCDVIVCNISPRGLMMKCDAPPPRGAFVEVLHRSVHIVGHVRWSHGRRLGIRTQDPIDIEALLAPAQIGAGKPRAERRPSAQARAAAPTLSIADRAEASRRFARAFDWLTIAAAVAIAATLVAQTAGAALKAPLKQVTNALTRAQR